MPQNEQQRSPSPQRSNSRSQFSKRHASFNSPREIPLPSPTVAHCADSFFLAKPVDSPTVSPQHTPLPFGHRRIHDSPSSSQISRPPMSMTLSQEDSLIASRRRNHARQPSSSAIAAQLAENLHLDNPAPGQAPPPAESSVIFPARPSSLAETYSLSYSAAHAMPSQLDRHSSSSLPIPSQIPFYTLPKASQTPSIMQAPAAEPSQPSPPESSSSNRSGIRCPSVSSEDNSSSGSSSSSRSDASVSTTDSSLQSESPLQKSPSSIPSAIDEAQQPSSAHVTSTESQPVPRPISPFRAPRPPPPQPRAPALEGTAMRRFMTPSQLQSAGPLASFSNSSPASAATAASFSSTSAMSQLTSDVYPPPEPPTILPPDPSHDVMQAPEVPNQAPYMPFLSHVLPPPDSWIQVETTNTEYKLLVRLPGFSREGITLATKRRRILHIVADSWENGGGHFERRIAFGYDADLVQVRAEFDGIMLRIVIPRRVSPITWNANVSTRMGRV